MRFDKKFGFSLAAALLVATGFTSGAAAADPPGMTVQGEGRHCVANLDTRHVACSDDPAQATRLSGSIDALTIAIFYDPTGFGAPTFTWTQARACTASYDEEWQWDNLGSLGWNNRVSSVRTYNRCDVKLFDGTGFGGAASTWIDSSSNLGAIGAGWSNRAGSVKFS